MKEINKLLLFLLVGGGIGFFDHVVWHLQNEIEFFGQDPHVINGIVYSLIGAVFGFFAWVIWRKQK